MRVWMLLLLLTTSGCTSMLLGNADSVEGSTATDGRSSAQIAADNSITGRVRRGLAADPLVGSYDIGIATAGNVVTLSGTVGSFDARDRAVRIATETDGVRSVNNRIAVNTNL